MIRYPKSVKVALPPVEHCVLVDLAQRRNTSVEKLLCELVHAEAIKQTATEFFKADQKAGK